MIKKQSAQKFFKAVEAINDKKNYEANKKTLNDNLDKAVAEYIKAHNLSSALGFFDCMNHYNNTYAK